LVSPYMAQREGFKYELGENIKEVYVHTTDIRGREQFHVAEYNPPLENFVDIDTTNRSEFEAFQELKLKLGL
jgi:hypothetical protein